MSVSLLRGLLGCCAGSEQTSFEQQVEVKTFITALDASHATIDRE